MAKELKPKEQKKRGPKPKEKAIAPESVNEPKTKDPVSAPASGEAYTVKLDGASAGLLMWIGKGDLSSGIRKLVDYLVTSPDWKSLGKIRGE